ncbi:MAG TPA: dihydrolipoamide acetyltransferase family protein [Ktedonobacterales bacterium]|jgi:pyruvate dehydrogenase E2 component (dihydrolipoamide acetyltransferase)
MLEFKLPDVGEGIHEAEVLRWLVKPGDQIKLDQPMVEIQADKGLVEIPSPVAGTVKEIRVPQNKMARVGDVLILLDPQGGSQKSSQPAKAAVAAQPASAASSVPAPSTNGAQATQRRAQAAPAARKLAFELGVNIDQVTGSGPGGRITMEDVRTFVAKPPVQTTQAAGAESAQADLLAARPLGATLVASQGESTTTESREPLAGLRRRIAERMELAWRTIPHATAFDEADGAALMALRHELQPNAEKQGVHLTYLPLLIKLLVRVLKEFPIFNASLDEERREIVYKRYYHIGLATNTPDGLIVSVLRDADKRTLLDLAREAARLTEAGRQRRLTLPELTGSTFTLNNVGAFGGGGTGVPIINPPEVAILAVGAIKERPVARQGTIIARPTLPLSLSFDHRLIDGSGSSAFMRRFKELVEQPSLLLLDSL